MSCKIVIIEDDPVLNQLADIILSKEGYDVDSFTDPEEAVLYVKNNPYVSLVITDFEMGNYNGYQVFVAINSVNPSISIIVWSGTYNDFILDMEKNGMVSYIRKDCDSWERLKDGVSKCLRQKKVSDVC